MGSKSSLAVLVDGQVKWTKSVKTEHRLITITKTQTHRSIIYIFQRLWEITVPHIHHFL